MKVILLSLLMTVVSKTLPAQERPSDTLVVPGVRVGSITTQTTLTGLRRLYGPTAVVDSLLYVGEGEFQPGTVVFPNDSTLTLRVWWRAEGADTLPERIQILGSAWHTGSGIRLGTSLAELERLNGRPFVFSGFNWDYSGTVLSWEGGALGLALDSMPGRVLVRLSPAAPNTDRRVAGDRDFSSSHPVMRELNPSIYDWAVEFPRPRHGQPPNRR